MFVTDTSVFWVYFIRICARSSDAWKNWKWRVLSSCAYVGSWLQYGGWNNVNTTAVCLRYVLHQRHWKRRQTFDICREQTYSMSATWCSYRTDEHRRRVIKMAAVLFRVSLADTEHWLHTIISSEPDFITSLHSVFLRRPWTHDCISSQQRHNQENIRDENLLFDFHRGIKVDVKYQSEHWWWEDVQQQLQRLSDLFSANHRNVRGWRVYTSTSPSPPVAAGGDGEDGAIIKANNAAEQTTRVPVRPLGFISGTLWNFCIWVMWLENQMIFKESCSVRGDRNMYFKRERNRKKVQSKQIK